MFDCEPSQFHTFHHPNLFNISLICFFEITWYIHTYVNRDWCDDSSAPLQAVVLSWWCWALCSMQPRRAPQDRHRNGSHLKFLLRSSIWCNGMKIVAINKTTCSVYGNKLLKLQGVRCFFCGGGFTARKEKRLYNIVYNVAEEMVWKRSMIWQTLSKRKFTLLYRPLDYVSKSLSALQHGMHAFSSKFHR